MANKPVDLSGMSREELEALKADIVAAERKYLVEELRDLEDRVNELRIRLGLKKRPLSKL